MNLKRPFAIAAAILLFTQASQLAQAATLPTASISYNFAGQLSSDTDSTGGVDFESAGFTLNGPDGMSMSISGDSSWYADLNGVSLQLSRSIKASSAYGETAYASLLTTVILNFEYAVAGNLALDISGLLDATATVTLNGNLVSPGVVNFLAGENTLSFDIELYTNSADNNSVYYTLEVDAVPEPGTWAMFAFGAATIVGVARSRPARTAA